MTIIHTDISVFWCVTESMELHWKVAPRYAFHRQRTAKSEFHLVRYIQLTLVLSVPRGSRTLCSMDWAHQSFYRLSVQCQTRVSISLIQVNWMKRQITRHSGKDHSSDVDLLCCRLIHRQDIEVSDWLDCWFPCQTRDTWDNSTLTSASQS